MRWFWAWAAVGAGAAICLVSFGPLFGAPVIAAAVVMGQRPAIRRSAFGLLSGAGLVFLYIAYLQRDGPRDHGFNPAPWLVLGLVCVAAGVVGHAARRP